MDEDTVFGLPMIQVRVLCELTRLHNMIRDKNYTGLKVSIS